MPKINKGVKTFNVKSKQEAEEVAKKAKPPFTTIEWGALPGDKPQVKSKITYDGGEVDGADSTGN